jgi:hypothetical protein
VGRPPRKPTANGTLGQYVGSRPDWQNALDIFRGEWASRLPGAWGALEAGEIPLFEDTRVQWAIDQLGGVTDKTVLELGALEGGHTYMLEQRGAASIVAIEANTRAYLRCLIVKELMELRRARFLCGDFVQYLRTGPGPFDFCLASGVLYHMTDPVELLRLVGLATPRVYLWTHYYDEDLVRRNPALVGKFTERSRAERAGFAHTLHRYDYQAAARVPGFCGGPAPSSHWMTRDDILGCLRHLGWTDIRVGFEMPDHPHGPCFAIVATRTDR